MPHRDIAELLRRISNPYHWNLDHEIERLQKDTTLSAEERLRREAQYYQDYLSTLKKKFIDYVDATTRTDVKLNAIYEEIQSERVRLKRALKRTANKLRIPKQAEKYLAIVDKGYGNLFAELSKELNSVAEGAETDTNREISYQEPILDDISPPIPDVISAASWTGVITEEDRLAAIRRIVPVAQHEIQILVDILTNKRFNDSETADAIDRLRALHATLGELLELAEANKPLGPVVTTIQRHRDHLTKLVLEGAKLGIAAPAMTLGVSALLSLVAGLPTDTQLLGAVYASMVGADALRNYKKGK